MFDRRHKAIESRKRAEAVKIGGSAEREKEKIFGGDEE